MIQRTPEQIIQGLRGQLEDREERLEAQRSMTAAAQVHADGQITLRKIAEKQRDELQAKNTQLQEIVNGARKRADDNYAAWLKEFNERQRIARELVKMADENQNRIADIGQLNELLATKVIANRDMQKAHENSLARAKSYEEMNNDLVDLQNDSALWILVMDYAAKLLLKPGKYKKWTAYAQQLHDNPPDDI